MLTCHENHQNQSRLQEQEHAGRGESPDCETRLSDGVAIAGLCLGQTCRLLGIIDELGCDFYTSVILLSS